jgi:3-phenylpropionate/cinnamic acid dioxygenase small subunit
MPVSHERQIENLIARYAFLVDDGDFAGLGRLLGDADLTPNGGPIVRVAANIERFAHETLKTYDGSPRTRHVTTNVIVEVGDYGRSATSQSYCLPGLARLSIAGDR